jgi:hypothetical protein
MDFRTARVEFSKTGAAGTFHATISENHAWKIRNHAWFFQKHA